MDLTRPIPAPMLAALIEPVFYPIAFVYLDWPGDVVRAHSGVTPITWGGQIWTGVGGFGAIALPQEISGSMAATSATVELVAGPEDFDVFANDRIRNRDAEIWMGCLADRPGRPGGAVLLSDPVRVFSGTMDGMALSIEPASDGISCRASVRISTGPGARTAATIEHSEQDQALKYPGDTAGRHLALAMSRARALTWPAS